MFIIKKSSLIVSVLIMSFFVGYYVLGGWSEPSASPPDGNVGAPLNVGITAQTKTGNLSVPILYDSDDNVYFVNPASTGTSALFAGSVGIGTTTLGVSKLKVQGDATITGKLTLGTLDPQYTIDGTDYATYGASVAGGVKEETMGIIKIQKSKCKSQNENQELKICEYTIDFSNHKKGSDLWLFSKVTDFGKNMEYLVVNLSAGGDFRVWYEKVPLENKIIIYAEKEGEVSFRLIANRHDWKDWPNLVK